MMTLQRTHRFLATVAFATVAFFFVPGHAATENDRLAGFLADVYQRKTADSPMTATAFGMKTGNDLWDDLSAEAEQKRIEQIRKDLAFAEQNFDPARLDDRWQIQLKVFIDEQKLLLERYRWRNHLYALNQIVGLHVDVPGLLANQHLIDTEADARAYIRRLQTVGPLFDQFIASMDGQVKQGFTMPQTVYPLLIGGARQIISGAPFDDGADNPVWSDFKRKIAALDLPETEKNKLLAEARAALLTDFKPAYDKLITTLDRHAKLSKIDGGVWQMPDGDAFYAFLVRQFTTTSMTPEQIHQLGLAEAERIRGEMRVIMQKVGFTGTLEEFMESLKSDPRFFFDNTDEGRAAYMQQARDTVDAVKARITELFYQPPSIPIEVRRFEAYREKSSPSAYYEAGSPDGRRPGYIYLNFSDMKKTAIYDLEALLYHEGIPGHHMQISTILADQGIPDLRKVNQWWLNSAFVEGWALYAERLPKDLGFYQDPYADFGRLAGELWRAYRLVVDSGLHYKRWSREDAIRFLNENTSSPEAANIRAVDRYLAVPGQATSFMVGMKKFLELRDKAQTALGDKFDIREFHDIALRNGYVPLWAVEQAVDGWIAADGQSRREK